MEVVAASYAGAIKVELFHDEETGKDLYRIVMMPWLGCGVMRVIEEGEVGK